MLLKKASDIFIEISDTFDNNLEKMIILQNICRRVVVNALISISPLNIFLIMLLSARLH